jgi:CDP-diacylglycerol--glycerol-3-phosphate 3-phosphatidyltransferase
MQISAEQPVMNPFRIRRERFWNAPNAITLGRIAASFFLLLLPLFDGPFGSRAIGLGFLAVSLTDLVDGYLARRDGTVTRIGKLLDPLADKVLVMTAFIILVAVQGRIPLWGVPMVVLILARELAVTGLRAMASSEGVVLQASSLGKWKTGFQTAALTCLIMHYTWLGLPLHGLGIFLLVLATALTLWSGYDYFASYLGGRKGAES